MADEHRAIPMDAEQAALFAETAASITTAALNGLSEGARAGVAARLQAGGQLYLHVQMVPEYVVVLALDPAPGDSACAPLEIARFAGAAPDSARVVLN